VTEKIFGDPDVDRDAVLEAADDDEVAFDEDEDEDFDGDEEDDEEEDDEETEELMEPSDE
jgi:hypothetical protein